VNLDILWITDPHLDHLTASARSQWFGRIESFDGDGVLLTGDIGESDTVCGFLDELSRLHHSIWFVLGNHDYYGSTISSTRSRVEAFAVEHDTLHYLHCAEPIYYHQNSVLIGVDGWSDGRAGDFSTSNIMLNDYRRIGELSGLESKARLARLKELGDIEAGTLRRTLAKVNTTHIRHVRIATHVPPFPEACWYEGSNEINEWTPHFTCVAVGKEILQFAHANPTTHVEVLCGHAHNEGSVTLAPNLRIETGRAVYGDWTPHRILTWA
jgi:Icc protein